VLKDHAVTGSNVPEKNQSLPRGYEDFLKDLKDRIRSAQIRAALSVNRELVLLYWTIGRDILIRQRQHGWGAKVVDRLAGDLRREFPEMAGLSLRNLKYMRALAEAYPDQQFVQQAVAQIPWGHNVRILDYVKSPSEREWYIRQTVENGWSRNILVHQIETGLYKRQGKALTNFPTTLPPPQSDLAQQIIKDPYNFDFLTLAAQAQEREVERGLIEHIRDFLLELGVGFSFVGSQYPLEVGGQEFRLDLLFYHLRLRAFVVVELKAGEFQPEFSGKMNFYLSAIDDLLRHPDDKPSIGMILCKSKNKAVAEYALRDLRKPVGVSEYRLAEALLKVFQRSLPTVKQLEAELKQDPDTSLPSGGSGTRNLHRTSAGTARNSRLRGPGRRQNGRAISWRQSIAGVCLRRAKADSPFPNDGPRNSVQHFRTRKVAAPILRQWRNR
jgi:predicted nuclease of restriction endonuclease-like (RecB) superfamily